MTRNGILTASHILRLVASGSARTSRHGLRPCLDNLENRVSLSSFAGPLGSAEIKTMPASNGSHYGGANIVVTKPTDSAVNHGNGEIIVII
jgi:hypothetical protein